MLKLILLKLSFFKKKNSKNIREQMNDAAWQSSQAQLIPCPNCARTFFPERLPVHLKACKPKPGQAPVATNTSVSSYDVRIAFKIKSA